MDPRLSSIAALYAKNRQLLVATLDGVDDERYRHVLIPDTSPMAWILGHLVGSRHLGNRLLGGDEQFVHADRFKRGSAADDPASLPAARELLATWQSISERFESRLASATAVLLDGRGPHGVPSTDDTVLGTVTFLALHESYHLGQLGLLRKASGLPGLAG